MIALLLSLSAGAEDYRMNDVGGSVVLPGGWSLMDNGWTDYDFKAQSDTSLLMKLWLTPFQPELTDAAAKHWAEQYVGILERVWYGDHTATRELFAAFEENHNAIFHGEEPA